MEDNRMHQGSIDIANVGDDPELYAATFATSGDRKLVQAARSFTRFEEVDDFLQQVGIPSHRIKPALGRAPGQ
jgi:hypothetical protein